MNPIDAYAHLYSVAVLAIITAGALALAVVVLAYRLWTLKRPKPELSQIVISTSIDFQELQKIVNTTKHRS
jgi:hypothetical protein